MRALNKLDEEGQLLLGVVRELMGKYGESYWNKMDESQSFPEDFVKEFMKLGLGAILIPKEWGGGGKGVREASLILREINLLGGNSYFVHGHYYLTAMLVRCAGKEMRDWLFPEVVQGKTVMTLALTEPEAGSDSTRISTLAERQGDRFVVSGRKVFISRISHTDYFVLVARTKRVDEVRKKTEGVTLFLVDANVRGLQMRKIRTMSNTDAYELALDKVEVPEDRVIGEVDRGFPCLLKTLNAERVMIAAELLGNVRWFLEKSVDYAKRRVVFGRPIGANQGVQFPLAEVYARLLALEELLDASVEAVEGEEERRAGEMANALKYLSAELAWDAANVAMDVHGGYGYASDLGIERKLRETRLYKVAPVSQNLALSYIATAVLGLPRSY